MELELGTWNNLNGEVKYKEMKTHGKMNDWEDGARKLTGSTRKFRGQKQSLKLNSQDS